MYTNFIVGNSNLIDTFFSDKNYSQGKLSLLIHIAEKKKKTPIYLNNINSESEILFDIGIFGNANGTILKASEDLFIR